MTAPLRISIPADGPEPPSPPRDAVSSWLGVLCSMLRMPAPEKESVRDELESHLRERVRDLMLAGAGEAEAARQAIAELGDAAALARRYQEAVGYKKRRILMHAAAFSIAGVALTLSGVAFFRSPAPCPPEAAGSPTPPGLPLLLNRATLNGRTGELMVRPIIVDPGGLPGALGASEQRVRASMFEPPADEAEAMAAALELTVPNGATWGWFLDRVRSEHVSVQSGALESAGIAPDHQLGVSGKASFLKIIQLLNEPAAESPSALALRLDGETLVLATQGYFDARESVIVVYDLTPLVDRRAERSVEPPSIEDTVEQAMGVVTGLVYPDAWVDNGGDLASMRRFDAKVFIKAPRRFHARIRWVIDELLAPVPQRQSGGVGGRNGAPALQGIPLVGSLLGAERDVTSAIGQGDYLIRAGQGGGVEIVGPLGAVHAGEIRVQGQALASGANPPPGPAAGASIVKAVPMARTDAMEVCAAIARVFRAVPELGRDVRVLPEANTNAVILSGDGARVAALAGVAGLLDMPGPLTDTSHSATEQFRLKAARATDLRDILGRFFNLNPEFKECGVERVMEVDSGDNTLTVTCTPGQLACVRNLVLALDRR